MSEGVNGIQWLVEERDRLRARVGVLEAELAMRDEIASRGGPRLGAFSVEVSELDVRLATAQGERTRMVIDSMVTQLAREIVTRSLHHISKGPNGELRLVFDARVVRR